MTSLLGNHNLITSSADPPTEPTAPSDHAVTLNSIFDPGGLKAAYPQHVPSPPTSSTRKEIDAAEAAIDTLHGNAKFQRLYRTEGIDGHDDAVRKEAMLFRIIAGEPADQFPPIEKIRDGLIAWADNYAPPKFQGWTTPSPEATLPHTIDGILVDPPVADPLTQAEITPEEKERRELLAVEKTLGPKYPDRLANLREWMGVDVTEAVEDAGYGNDADALGQLVDLCEADHNGWTREFLRQYVAKDVTHAAASIEAEKKRLDASFIDAYLDGNHPQHQLRKAEMKALDFLSNPPPWAVATLDRMKEVAR